MRHSVILSFLLIQTLLLSSCTIYQSIGKSFGAFVSKPKGPPFTEVANVPADQAIVYIYRPYNSWSATELESPSFYVNDKRLFGVKGGMYTYYYLTPGTYDIVMRRPLGGLEGIKSMGTEVNFTKILSRRLMVEAGKVYYYRYSEVTTPPVDIDDAEPEGKDPLFLVSQAVAMKELPDMKLLSENGTVLMPVSETENEEAIKE